MAAKGAQRSYFAFLREVKASHGLTQKQAVAAYRTVKERTGKAPTATYARNNAAETRSAIRTAKGRLTRDANRREREWAQERAEQVHLKRSRAAQKGAMTRAANRAAMRGGEAGAAPPARVGTIRDLEQWEALGAWLWEDAEWVDYHAGVEYESTD